MAVESTCQPLSVGPIFVIWCGRPLSNQGCSLFLELNWRNPALLSVGWWHNYVSHRLSEMVLWASLSYWNHLDTLHQTYQTCEMMIAGGNHSISWWLWGHWCQRCTTAVPQRAWHSDSSSRSSRVSAALDGSGMWKMSWERWTPPQEHRWALRLPRYCIVAFDHLRLLVPFSQGCMYSPWSSKTTQSTRLWVIFFPMVFKYFVQIASRMKPWNCWGFGGFYHWSKKM